MRVRFRGQGLELGLGIRLGIESGLNNSADASLMYNNASEVLCNVDFTHNNKINITQLLSSSDTEATAPKSANHLC